MPESLQTGLILALLALAIVRLPPHRKPAGVIVALFLSLILLSPADPVTGRLTGLTESLWLLTALGVGGVLLFWGYSWDSTG